MAIENILKSNTIDILLYPGERAPDGTRFVWWSGEHPEYEKRQTQLSQQPEQARYILPVRPRIMGNRVMTAPIVSLKQDEAPNVIPSNGYLFCEISIWRAYFQSYRRLIKNELILKECPVQKYLLCTDPKPLESLLGIPNKEAKASVFHFLASSPVWREQLKASAVGPTTPIGNATQKIAQTFPQVDSKQIICTQDQWMARLHNEVIGWVCYSVPNDAIRYAFSTPDSIILSVKIGFEWQVSEKFYQYQEANPETILTLNWSTQYGRYGVF